MDSISAQFNSKSQPVAIRDVIKYLVGILETPDLSTRIYHIGGKDVMTYKDLILHFARVHNRRIVFFDVSWLPVPVEILCRIYAYWLHFFISVPVNITSLLLNSMKSDVVCSDHEIKKLLPFEPLDFKTAVTWAKEKENQSRVFSHWSDVPPDQMNELMPLCKFEASEFVIGEYSVTIPADPETIFPVMCRIGGGARLGAC